MATRGYPPQPHHYPQQHQPPPQRQYGYDQRPDPRWQEPPQQRMPPPRQQQQPPAQQYGGYDDQYGYQQGYDGYNQGYDQQSYAQDQQYQETPQYNDQYYDQHRGHPPPQRQYNYDERYHQQSQGRQPPPTNGMPPQRPRTREGQRPPPLQEQKKNKQRERILAPEPESPKTLAWDNPFGAFPPKKEDKKEKKDEKSGKDEGHKRHGSLDATQQRLGDWDNHRRGDQPDLRPHTSHSNRKNNDPPRPNTSHGQRPPPAPTPAFEGDDEMRFGKYRPDPVGPSTTVQPLRPNLPPAPQGLPTRIAPQRSVTQPIQSNTGPIGVNGYDYNRPAPNDKHAMVGLRPPVRQASNHQYDSDPGYGAPISKSQTFDQPRDPRDKHAMVETPPPVRQGSNQQYDHEPNYDPPNSRNQNYNQPDIGPEMPNFDAMAPNVDETLTGPKAVDVPVYAKKSYQALTVETQPQRPAPPQGTASPLADFSFDLPQSSSAPLELEYRSPVDSRQQQYPPMGQQNYGARSRGPSGGGPGPVTEVPFDYNNPPLSPPVPPQNQRNYDSRSGPQGPPRNQNQTPSQFPPRGASRADVDGPRRPSNQSSQQDSGYWAGADAGAMRQGPDNGQYPGPGYPAGRNEYDQYNGYDQGYGEQYPRDPYDQRQEYGRDPYGPGPDHKSPPHKGYATSGHMQSLPQRPATSNSAHPPPTRNYGDRGSSDTFRPEMPPAMNGGMDRPPPIRPGLMNSQPPPRGPPGPQTMQQQPPPMRQQQQQQPPPPPPPQNQPQSHRTSTSSEEQPRVTVAELNQMREQFKERPQDFKLGLRFAKRLVEAAKVLSDENGRADPKQVARNRERYINDAHKVVKKMVSAGSTEAMFYMADCYGNGGLGLPIDPKEAFHLYQSAAKLNHPQSAYRVAVCCELGTDQGGGTRRDPMKAIQWYKRAATLGDTPAMYKMGMILLKGLLGQQRDPRQAVSWLKRAAERADKDNPHALHELGLLYESARPEDHILRDERYAFDLFRQAAELGYKYSQYRLGSVFEYGSLGCPIDQRQSIQWYSKAASQGEHQSELALSGWYLTGATEPNGEPLVQVNEQEAFLWARKAASSGLAKAEFAMGYFSEMGIGTRADVEDAKRWYYRAAAQDFPQAKERLEQLKMGAKGRRKDIRRSNRKEGDCVVM